MEHGEGTTGACAAVGQGRDGSRLLNASAQRAYLLSMRPCLACSYDVHGNRSGQAGPTPLLRQQLLGGAPGSLSVAAAAAGAASAPRSAAPAAAATPVEVKALRDEVKALRDEAAALRVQVRLVGLVSKRSLPSSCQC